MDIGKNTPSGVQRAHQRYRDAMVDLIRRTRSKVQHERHEAARTRQAAAEDARTEATERRERLEQARSKMAESRQADRIDISPESQERVRTALAEGDDEVQRPKIERLKHAYRTGKLFSPERLEAAAERMLQGNPEAVRETDANDRA